MRTTERVLINADVERLIAKEQAMGAAMPFADVAPDVAGAYPNVMCEGDMDAGAWSCGMVAGLIHDSPTMAELIERTMAEAEAIIHSRLNVFLGASATAPVAT